MASAAATDSRGRLRAEGRRAGEFLAHHGDRLLVAGLAAIFVAITVWWVDADTRVPSGDNAKHTLHAFSYLDQFQAGHYLFGILHWTHYPPLVHVVGALGSWIGGASNDTVVLTENLVFVPLLVAGCYGAGRIVYGRLGGVLAVVFALGAPMVISLFHVFMLDGPGAAVAAVAVWLLLASRRYASLWWTVAAAVAAAAGMHVKATFVFFVAGLALMLFARGGWRYWRHALVGAAVFLILVEPWYFVHLQDLRGLTTGAINAQGGFWYADVPYPARWSVENFTWYGWALVNTQLYLPLTLLFLTGAVWTVVEWIRDWRTESYAPDLLVGAVFAYVGISSLSLDDPRYTLPGIVYLAVLGTGWITRLPPTPRIFGVGAVCTVALMNTMLINYANEDPNLAIELPGKRPSPIAERSFTVVSNRGYIEARPGGGGLAPEFVELLRRAREDGARQVVFQPESMNSGGFNLDALAIFARLAGLQMPGSNHELLAPNDIYVFRIARSQAPTPPCLESHLDDTGIFMVKGPPTLGKPYYCPPADQ